MPHSSPPEPPSKPKSLRDRFVAIARRTSEATGTAWAFLAAVMIVVIWAACGPMFQYSETWQLVVNTGTTIITFLMVFLVQSTQNRDSKAVHLKLDELIRAMKGARNDLVDLEELSEEELEKLADEFKQLHERACHTVNRRAQKKLARLPVPPERVDALASLGEEASAAAEALEQARTSPDDAPESPKTR